ncbi:hypothetical protein Tco_0564910 [Tanacetum coccineum]
MGTKVTSSSGSVLEEPEIQKLQMQAKNLKENSLNKLNALKTTIQHLSSSNHSMYYEFREAFHRLFDANEGLFRSVLSRNMQNLEMQFSNETLHEKDSNSELRAIKGQFEHFIHSKMFELSKYNTNAREILQDFNAYTTMEAQTFKETIIQNMDSIEQCIIERASHEQQLKMTLKNLSERQLQIQQCKVQEVQSSVTSSGDETCSGIVSDEEIEKKELEAHYGFMAKIQEVLPAESSSTDTPLEQVQNNDEKNVFANERQHSEKHAAECADERAALANLIANFSYHKLFGRLKHDQNKSRDKDMEKEIWHSLLSTSRLYKPTNKQPSNSSNQEQDERYHTEGYKMSISHGQFGNQGRWTVAGARDTGKQGRPSGVKRLRYHRRRFLKNPVSTGQPLRTGIKPLIENDVFAAYVDQNAVECAADERAALANLIANLTLDTEEKTIRF